MARARGIYRRGDSPYWWIDVVLPDGRRLRESAKTAKREEAEALVAKLKGDIFRASHLGIKAKRSWGAWQTACTKAKLTDLRFHDLRHTWASWHRQAGTSCDELKDLGGWKTRSMVDRYAKFATENLVVAAARIESDNGGSPLPTPAAPVKGRKTEVKERGNTVGNVIFTSRFPHVRSTAA